ncbi:peptidoglycan recognition protein family protein [Rhodococcus artemisiae]|uniref:N-acetylmuramoyl-L-alanine amidase n=1 Tax=Rhodococcus artemisiae TaxID=714159 RepID=A0ABU7LBR4_9NOCA|nr:N-acetylmuramoyl-L-alanine amidase [Rhodococcus artemisiae]MEE2058982.1 N-acetylmuramoyl-L-alanine amidase [Rhodococcus artemisiae]
MAPKRDEYAREILRAGRDMGIQPKGIVIAFATVSVECDWYMYANRGDPQSLNFPHERVGSDANSVGLFQQRAPWWGTVAQRMSPYESAKMFFAELDKLNYLDSSRSPGWYAQAVQKSAYPDRYDQRMGEAQQLYDRIAGQQTSSPVPPRQEVHTVGDPIWLADVLRAAGLKCDIYPGAFNRGKGDFGEIWGVMWHHTGAPAGSAPGPRAIAEHPTLGLASQLHLDRNGKFTLCGVGIAWHAGVGSYPGLPTNDANRLMIGIEAENSGTEGWSPAQYGAYVRGTAAILRKLGRDSSRVLGHKDWAGKAQGKWDPGGIDMDSARRDVQQHINHQGSEGLFDMLPQHEQEEMRDKIRDLWNFLIDPKPSLVDGKPFSAASLLFTADRHSFTAASRTAKLLDLSEAESDKLDEVLAILKGKAGN